jgi:hypothetical protein
LKWVRGRTIAVAAIAFEVLWFVDAWAFVGLWAALLTVVVVVALTVAVIRTKRSMQPQRQPLKHRQDSLGRAPIRHSRNRIGNLRRRPDVVNRIDRRDAVVRVGFGERDPR